MAEPYVALSVEQYWAELPDWQYIPEELLQELNQHSPEYTMHMLQEQVLEEE